MFNIYANKYAPIDPLVPPCDINLIPIGYKGENRARCLVFDLQEVIDQFGEGDAQISFIRQGDTQPYLVTEVDMLDTNAIWTITNTDTAVAGYGIVQLQYIVGTDVCKSAQYRTVTFESNSETGDVPDPYQSMLDQMAAFASQASASATSAATSASNANASAERIIPTAMEAVGEWLDENITQETGYVIDKTLTVSNAAADAKVTGDRTLAAFATNEAEGAVASFDDGADGVPVKSLVVGIEPIQSGSGDPSPDNIRPISGFDAAKIIKRSKNLIIFTDAQTQTINGITFTFNNDGTVVANGTATAAANLPFSGYQSVVGLLNQGFLGLVGQTVILTGCPEGGSGTTYEMNCARFGHPPNSVSRFANDRGNGANYIIDDFSDETSDIYIRIHINSGVTCNNLVFKPMLRLAGTDDTFERADPQSRRYNISFGSAGTVYGGTLDVTNGVLTVTHIAYDMGNVSWQRNVALGDNVIFRGQLPNRLTGNNVTAICSMYPYNRTGSIANLANNLPDKSFGLQSTIEFVAVRDDSYTDVDTFTTAVTGQLFVYPIATPLVYNLTPTEVTTLLQHNNIWSDTGDTNVTYRADTKAYIENLTKPDDDMVADANIASGKYFMVGNTLYLATAAISAGETIVVGTNCTATNLAAALNAINA